MFLTYDTVEAFAVKRNPTLSFPFLKENGELLAISVNSGFLIEPRALELYMDFYNNAYKLTQRYPQYYRFTLGMALDLEAGGLPGGEGQKIADYVKQEDLVKFDTSDTRKLETLSLLSQIEDLSSEYQNIYSDIVRNVEQFVENPAWYKKFNKPLFYDLTHIIFFLTQYGTRATPLKNKFQACLNNIGLLALLDNDADLLSEVCLCLDYIGCETPQYWDEYLLNSLDDIQITYNGTIASALNPTVDEYHIYLVLNAYLAARNKPVFSHRFDSRTPSFSLPNQPQSLLSKLSEYAHGHHFNGRSKAVSIDVFESGLDEGEQNHWHKSLNSNQHSRALVEGFSGLS